MKEHSYSSILSGIKFKYLSGFVTPHPLPVMKYPLGLSIKSEVAKIWSKTDMDMCNSIVFRLRQLRTMKKSV